MTSKALIIASVLAVALTACNKKEDTVPPSSPTPSTPAPSTTTPPAGSGSTTTTPLNPAAPAANQ